MCFKEGVEPSVADYLIKKEGLKLGENKKPIESYSNVYSIVCPINQENKFMRLINKNLSNHIEWTDRRDKLIETRFKLIELIKNELDTLLFALKADVNWVHEMKDIEFLMKELKKTK